jgi:hypothetical protein
MEETIVSVELRILLHPFFKCPRVNPCECGGIHKDPLFPILPGRIQIQLFKGWSTCGVLAVFTGLKALKVRQI